MPSGGWVKTLLKELDRWVAAGIINPAQRDQLERRYASQHPYGRLVFSVLILGAILIGLGLILFVSSNWQHLGRVFKVTLIMAVIVGFNALGYVLQREPARSPRTGSACLLVGAIAYGAGIWLIAQIFQLPYNHTDSMLAWVLGLLPVIWVMRSGPILVLASILAPVWLLMLMAGHPEWGVWSYLFEYNPSRSAFYQYLPIFAVVMALVYRQRHRTALVLTLLGSLIWLGRFFWVQVDVEHLYQTISTLPLLYASFYAAYGLFLYSLGMAHERHEMVNPFAASYKLFAMLLLLVCNFSLTFAGHWKSTGPFVLPSSSVLIYLGFLAAGLIAGRFFTKADAQQRTEAAFILPMIALQLAGLHVGFLGGGIASLWFNLLLIGELLAFLWLSYLLKGEGMFRLALYGLALEILARYFDTFWGLLDRSLFFLIGGVLLVVGGTYMERKRKQITLRMRQGS